MRVHDPLPTVSWMTWGLAEAHTPLWWFDVFQQVKPRYIRKTRRAPNVRIWGDRCLKYFARQDVVPGQQRYGTGDSLLSVAHWLVEGVEYVGTVTADAMASQVEPGAASTRAFLCCHCRSTIPRVPLVSSCRTIFWCCSRKTFSESHLTLNDLATSARRIWWIHATRSDQLLRRTTEMSLIGQTDTRSVL
jgi:hypothetical protein